MTTRQPTIFDAINLDHALEFSYIDYHADAVKYLCLFRSTGLTVKAYFFDDGSNDDVLCPHNHRYSFDSRIITGALVEVRYAELAWKHDAHRGAPMKRYRYDCIAEGGTGFEFEDEVRMLEVEATLHEPGSSYSNRAHVDIHTLRAVVPGTIVLLTQYADVGPAYTFGWGDASPVCSYRKMERADVLRRVDQLQAALHG